MLCQAHYNTSVYTDDDIFLFLFFPNGTVLFFRRGLAIPIRQHVMFERENTVL